MSVSVLETFGYEEDGVETWDVPVVELGATVHGFWKKKETEKGLFLKVYPFIAALEQVSVLVQVTTEWKNKEEITKKSSVDETDTDYGDSFPKNLHLLLHKTSPFCVSRYYRNANVLEQAWWYKPATRACYGLTRLNKMK